MASDIDKEVVLMGWVDIRRDHGGAVFIDLRDRTGICQIVFDASDSIASPCRSQTELAMNGFWGSWARFVPVARTTNPKLPTGEIEIIDLIRRGFFRGENNTFSDR